MVTTAMRVLPQGYLAGAVRYLTGRGKDRNVIQKANQHQRAQNTAKNVSYGRPPRREMVEMLAAKGQ